MRLQILVLWFIATSTPLLGRLACAQSIEGTILEPDGGPAHTGRMISEEVAVNVEKQTPSGTWGRFGGAAHTDESGHYRFDGLPSGKYIVFAALPATMVKVAGGAISAGGPIIFAPGTLRTANAAIVEVGSSSHAEHVDVRVPPATHHISGVVVDAGGQPVRRGLIRLHLSGEPGLSRAMPLTDAGTFDFDRISSEHYTLHASSGNSLLSETQAAETNVVVQSSGGPEPVRLVLK